MLFKYIMLDASVVTRLGVLPGLTVRFLRTDGHGSIAIQESNTYVGWNIRWERRRTKPFTRSLRVTISSFPGITPEDILT